ncbi:MobQ family relaxase, partial [Eubacterium sp.]|uniref:MobQ family relaxase n=1 Tax=Eubacterium sp. TaxID=142586 RepID=UPI0026E0391B
MSIYHLSVKTISRNTGRSAVAAAAYRAGENIKNERDGIFHKYAGRKDVEYSKILLPKGAPERWQKRAILWNDVEHKEKRKDARTAREIEVGLPIEFDQEKRIEVLTKFCEQEFVSKGMIADINIHDKGDGNPHAHIMLTTRSIKGGEFGKKNRGWDCRENVNQWRKVWADVCNECLEEDQQIDHRSYEEQGRNQLPTIHEGSAATAMKRRGEYSE